MRIGVLGGTFNPVHIGHLTLADTARDELRLDRVIWVPSYIPPHKDTRELTDAENRYKMVTLAIKGNPYYSASRIELERKGKSYAIETLQELKRTLGGDTELFFISGADSLEELPTWKDPDGILKLAHFVVSERLGHSILEVPPGVIVLHPWRVNISSSEIRQRIQKGLSVRYLVPDEVYKFIEEFHLYREAKDFR